MSEFESINICQLKNLLHVKNDSDSSSDDDNEKVFFIHIFHSKFSFFILFSRLERALNWDQAILCLKKVVKSLKKILMVRNLF